ncbi:MAG: FAD:protein FMN transferase [Acidimicrobiia bacterium]
MTGTDATQPDGEHGEERVEEHLLVTQFRAMGTDVEILVLDGPDDLGDRAAAAVERLEAKWSRFRPTSELCRLNASGGAPVIVSKETLAVLERALDAQQATGGLYDPTILPDLEAAGYDRSFDEMESSPPGSPRPASRADARPDGRPAVGIDRVIGAVRVPPGVALDLGGIGKGYTADLVAPELLAAGARGVLVNMGGDLRAVGDPPGQGAWVVEIEDPLGTGRTGMVTLGTGAIATSTRLRRMWTAADGRAQHHLIDPRTGEPAHSGLASVTVIAGEAWRAEVLAKAAFVAGAEEGAALVERTGATGLFVTDDGEVVELAGLDGFRP